MQYKRIFPDVIKQVLICDEALIALNCNYNTVANLPVGQKGPFLSPLSWLAILSPFFSPNKIIIVATMASTLFAFLW